MAAREDTPQKKMILIVDDSRTVRISLSKILNSNFSIIEAENGEDGWNKLSGIDSIKLVITDIMMPQLDGYGLICRIRGSDAARLQKLPIIVVTSAEDELSRERAHACGANNFIVKPAKPEDLLERVNFHTEANLANQSADAPGAQFHSEVENAVIEAPDIEKALKILESGKTGPLAPYAVDVAFRAIPLLEYCNDLLDMSVEGHIAAIKAKLRSI